MKKIILLLIVSFAILISLSFIHISACYLTPKISSNLMGISIENYWENYYTFQKSRDGICNINDDDNPFNDADCKFDFKDYYINKFCR